jgi:hypothetical protein
MRVQSENRDDKVTGSSVALGGGGRRVHTGLTIRDGRSEEKKK